MAPGPWPPIPTPMILDVYIVTESFCPGGGIVWLITGKQLMSSMLPLLFSLYHIMSLSSTCVLGRRLCRRAGYARARAGTAGPAPDTQNFSDTSGGAS